MLRFKELCEQNQLQFDTIDQAEQKVFHVQFDLKYRRLITGLRLTTRPSGSGYTVCYDLNYPSHNIFGVDALLPQASIVSHQHTQGC